MHMDSYHHFGPTPTEVLRALLCYGNHSQFILYTSCSEFCSAGELGMVDEAPAALSQSPEASPLLLSSLEAASALVPVQPQVRISKV